MSICNWWNSCNLSTVLTDSKSRALGNLEMSIRITCILQDSKWDTGNPCKGCGENIYSAVLTVQWPVPNSVQKCNFIINAKICICLTATSSSLLHSSIADPETAPFCRNWFFKQQGGIMSLHSGRRGSNKKYVFVIWANYLWAQFVCNSSKKMSIEDFKWIQTNKQKMLDVMIIVLDPEQKRE